MAGVIITFLLTRQAKLLSKIEDLMSRTTANERDIANVAGVLYKNDMVNRLTRTETNIDSIRVNFERNIPDLWKKWDRTIELLNAKKDERVDDDRPST
jgi:hypothetical protein